VLRIAFGLQLPAVANTKHRTTPHTPANRRLPSPNQLRLTVKVIWFCNWSRNRRGLCCCCCCCCCAAALLLLRATLNNISACLLIRSASSEKRKIRHFCFYYYSRLNRTKPKKKTKKQKTRQNNNYQAVNVETHWIIDRILTLLFGLSIMTFEVQLWCHKLWAFVLLKSATSKLALS